MTGTRTRTGLTSLVMVVALIVGAAATAPAGAVTAAASVAVTSSANPSGFGQSIVLRGVVTDPATPRTQLTGSMTFADGSTILAVKAVSKGAASFTTRALTAGDHVITVSFTPADGGVALASPPLVQHVDLGASATTLAATRPVTYNGQSGGVTATVKAVAPATGVPTGSVDFYLDGSWYWTSTVGSDGKATLSYADLTPGTYAVTATYSGDANFDTSSTAGALAQTVLPNAPTAGLTFTPSVIGAGGTSQLVVSATNNGPTPMASVAIGVLLPPLSVAIVSQPPGAGCRRALGNLLYCLVSLPRGATRKLVLNVTGGVSGTYTASSYARNVDTGDETYATASLTVQ